MAARQRHYESDKVAKQDFLEYQRVSKADLTEARRGFSEEINITYDRIDTMCERLERGVLNTESRIKAALEGMEARIEKDREAAEARIEKDRKASEARLENERKEFQSTKRWMFSVFVALVALSAAVLGLLPEGFYNLLP